MTAVRRCAWAPLDDPAYLAYHDEEWGVPLHDDARLFEMLTLEGAQAGLSWSTILHKREGYRRAFANFDAAKVARFTAAKVERLLQDPSIVRNRLKMAVHRRERPRDARGPKEFGSLDSYLWGLVGGVPLLNRWRAGDIPAETPVVTRDEQGPQASRLPVRRSDGLLRVHASHRHGQWARSVVLPMGRGSGAQSLSLDDTAGGVTSAALATEATGDDYDVGRPEELPRA